ncbi:MAG: inositol 2-dehydrogenase [Williamsia sp.]|nr:inositol 2-dehydrogenase [Williamsia sp.]
MKKLKLALLGMGRMGKTHYRNIQQSSAGASIVVVADPLYQPAAGEFGPEVSFVRDPEEAIAHPDVDAVIVATPTDTHAGMVEKAIAHGKPVFCEKPLDLSLRKTAAIEALARSRGVKLMLGFNRRFDPDFIQARRAVQEGRIGKVHIVKITNRDPDLPPIPFLKTSGGLFMDFSIHDFDMARYITGRNVIEVFARGAALIDPAVATGANDIDTALITLTLDDGSWALIDNSRKAVFGYDQRLEIFGEAGMIQVDNNTYHRNVRADAAGIHHALPLHAFPERYARSYVNEIEAFVQTILRGEEPPATAADSLQATLAAVAANRSMQENRPVKLSEIGLD